MRGFAFVLFKNMCGASKALNALNLKEIKGQSETLNITVRSVNTEAHCGRLSLGNDFQMACFTHRAAGSS